MEPEVTQDSLLNADEAQGEESMETAEEAPGNPEEEEHVSLTSTQRTQLRKPSCPARSMRGTQSCCRNQNLSLVSFTMEPHTHPSCKYFLLFQ